MLKQRNNPSLGNGIHHRFSGVPWGAVAIAAAILVVGGAFILSLPEDSNNKVASPVTEASADARPNPPDDTLCERQTWPYIDQRCAQRVEAARDTRKVRIVTDKGTSATTVTPVP